MLPNQRRTRHLARILLIGPTSLLIPRRAIVPLSSSNKNTPGILRTYTNDSRISRKHNTRARILVRYLILGPSYKQLRGINNQLHTQKRSPALTIPARNHLHLNADRKRVSRNITHHPNQKISYRLNRSNHSIIFHRPLGTTYSLIRLKSRRPNYSDSIAASILRRSRETTKQGLGLLPPALRRTFII